MAEADDATGPVCHHLAVVSHVVHHRWQGEIHAYTPYARELDLWASMVDRLTVAAPVRDAEPPPDTSPLRAGNVALAPQIEAGGDDLRAKLAQLARLPAMVRGVDRAIRDADAVQVRCPGNLGLIGALVAPLRCRRVVAKYAGQWRRFDGEPRPWRLQRAILRSRWFRGPVLVYGPAPTDRAHVIPAFSSAVDDDVLASAAAVAAARHADGSADPGEPLRVLFVGRLTAAKHVDAVIAAIGALTRAGVPATLRIVGDGPERPALAAAAAGLAVELVGAVEQSEVLTEYAAADVLVLASESEGWPKAIVEAMAFGVVCIGNDGGMVPTILGEGRGLTVPRGDADAVARELTQLAGDRLELERRSTASARWAARFSLEEYGRELRRVLAVAWSDGCDRLHPPVVRGVVELAAPGRAEPSAPAPTRVLQVIDSLAVGGAEQMAVHLANELARRGHESALVATRRAGPLADALDPSVWWRCLDRAGRFDPAAIGALRAIVRERGIEVVHAHSTSVFLVAAAFAVGPRPVIVWHDHLGGAAHRNPWPLRLVTPWVDAGVAASAEIEADDRRRLWLGDRLALVPNFSVLDVDAAPAPDLPGRSGARIVCVANVRPPKDQLTLVRALARVVPTHPDVMLLLVGHAGGPYADEVRAEIDRLSLGPHVALLGVRTDVASVLAASDIGVLSSTEEGTPLAVIEYGMAGLPVVATAVGEVAEMLDRPDDGPDGQPAGRLVAPGDPEALAAELCGLLDDPAERVRAGSAVRDRLEQRYSPRAMTERWEDVYRGAATRRRAARDSR